MLTGLHSFISLVLDLDQLFDGSSVCHATSVDNRLEDPVHFVKRVNMFLHPGAVFLARKFIRSAPACKNLKVYIDVTDGNNCIFNLRNEMTLGFRSDLKQCVSEPPKGLIKSFDSFFDARDVFVADPCEHNGLIVNIFMAELDATQRIVSHQSYRSSSIADLHSDCCGSAILMMNSLIATDGYILITMNLQLVAIFNFAFQQLLVLSFARLDLLAKAEVGKCARGKGEYASNQRLKFIYIFAKVEHSVRPGANEPAIRPQRKSYDDHDSQNNSGPSCTFYVVHTPLPRSDTDSNATH